MSTSKITPVAQRVRLRTAEEETNSLALWRSA